MAPKKTSQKHVNRWLQNAVKDAAERAKIWQLQIQNKENKSQKRLLSPKTNTTEPEIFWVLKKNPCRHLWMMECQDKLWERRQVRNHFLLLGLRSTSGLFSTAGSWSAWGPAEAAAAAFDAEAASLLAFLVLGSPGGVPHVRPPGPLDSRDLRMQMVATVARRAHWT